MEPTGIYAREFERLGRAVQLGIASGQVIDVAFPEAPPADAERDNPLLDRIGDYLGGAEDDFEDVEIAITVSTEERQVLDAVQQIPYGESGTVRQVAHMANLDPDDEDDVETLRTALRANPVPIFVPDHRVEDAPGATPSDVASTLREVER